MLRLLSLCALALSLAACATTRAADPAELPGTTWRVVRLEANDVPADAGMTLAIQPNRISGNSGVNAFQGEAEFGGEGAFRAGPLAMTRRAGPPDAMARESLYLVCLERADGWMRRGEELALLAGDTVLLVAVPADEPSDG